MWPLSQQKVAAEWSAFLHIGAGRLVTSPGWRFACQLPLHAQGCHGTESARGRGEGANVKADLESA